MFLSGFNPKGYTVVLCEREINHQITRIKKKAMLANMHRVMPKKKIGKLVDI
jgi:hypothetical protein